MSSLRRIVVFVAGFVLIFGLVLVINQTLLLADFAERLHPVAGDAVFWGLIFIYLVFLLVPIVLFLRLPKRLVLPSSEQDPAYPLYLQRLGARLAANPRVDMPSVETRDEIELALGRLAEEAEAVVKKAGSRVFLTTAISQNGALDTLLVLGLQTRLIWDVAHVYAQRPALRDLAYLYANVVGTAFLVGELDETDLSEQVQPALSSILGSAASAVPGLQAASTVFVNSVVSGTANAFLTLRVGLIAQEYCCAVVRPERRSLRKSAVSRAAAMLGKIAASGAAKVAAAVTRASGRTVSGVVSGVGRQVRRASEAIAERLPFRARSLSGKDPELDE